MNHESISAFQSVLATIFKNNKIFDINASPGYPVFADLANKERLSIIVQGICSN